MTATRRMVAAITVALLCHGLFGLAVGSMALALATGMQLGFGTVPGPAGWAVNMLLAAQFPIVHSALLSRGGLRWLARLSPVGYGRKLTITTYVISGSLQLLLAFWLWTPSGVVWHTPEGSLGVAQYALFGAAWLFLVKALWDAGLPTQSGAAGWWALLRDRPVDYGNLPTEGLFACCRQPIYFGFALVLWTAPTWSLDWLALTVTWTAYCVLGPMLKEARWERMFGDEFKSYRTSVPYFLPRIRH